MNNLELYYCRPEVVHTAERQLGVDDIEVNHGIYTDSHLATHTPLCYRYNDV